MDLVCSNVILGASSEDDTDDDTMYITTPYELESNGIELIDIDEEYLHDCWCSSDPIPSLEYAGYTISEDSIFGDWYAYKKPAVRFTKEYYSVLEPEDYLL